jgi:hypothetical protein
MSSLIAILAAEAAVAGAPYTGLEGEPVVGPIAAAEATQTATPLVCDNPTRDNSVLSRKPLHLVIKR